MSLPEKWANQRRSAVHSILTEHTTVWVWCRRVYFHQYRTSRQMSLRFSMFHLNILVMLTISNVFHASSLSNVNQQMFSSSTPVQSMHIMQRSSKQFIIECIWMEGRLGGTQRLVSGVMVPRGDPPLVGAWRALLGHTPELSLHNRPLQKPTGHLHSLISIERTKFNTIRLKSPYCYFIVHLDMKLTLLICLCNIFHKTHQVVNQDLYGIHVW